MELGRCLKHVYVLSFIVLVVHVNCGLSLAYRHANVTTRCVQREREALLAIKQDLLDETNRLSSWGDAQNQQDCCTWEGVHCDNQTGHVAQLHLGAKELKGTISPKLAELHHLTYLDLSYNNFNTSQIPNFVGSLSNLKYLDLSGAGFGGEIPYHQLGNLTHLQYLDLSNNDFTPVVENLIVWLPRLSSLKYLDLSYMNLSRVSDWLESVNKLPNLSYLTLGNCDLPPPILSTLSHINSSNSLARVDLHGNRGLTSSILVKWLSNYNTTLVDLDLSSTQFSRRVPDSIGQLTSLQSLHLYENELIGPIPESIGKLTSLQSLDLSTNGLSGRVPESIGRLVLLEVLDLSGNNLSGRLPEAIGQMSSLKRLNISENQLSGTIPDSIGKLTSLQFLYMFDNGLSGRVPESIGQLKLLEVLDISGNNLSGRLVEAIWKMSYASLKRLELSGNQLSGLPDHNFGQLFGASLANQLEVHLSSNQFEGPVPSFLSQVSYLDLSNNKFSEMSSFMCARLPKVDRLKFLDLSYNHIAGELPDCLGYLNSLELLDLSNNFISGKIPSSLGSLSSLATLKLRTNRLVGELPSSLKDCTNLQVIDLGDNKLSRSVPAWLGVRFPDLVVLMLQSNQFSGSLPPQLCQLTNVQILDLSRNQLTGTIPKCIYNLTSLAKEGNPSKSISHSFFRGGWGNSSVTENTKVRDRPAVSYIHGERYSIRYENEASFMWKGRMAAYKSILGLVKSIDLSTNRLTGEIPAEITRLLGLKSLNLSRNQLTGPITQEIGQLQSLDSLDLSRNELNGRIPTSLTLINRIGYLDL